MRIDYLTAFAEYVRLRDKDIEAECDNTKFEANKLDLALDFFIDNKALIPDFVRFAFRNDKSKSKILAIRTVAYFHDEILDLTTIEESKPYFKQW